MEDFDDIAPYLGYFEDNTQSNKEILLEDDHDAIDAFVDSLLLDDHDHHQQVHSFNNVDCGDHGSTTGNIKLLGMEIVHHVPMNPTSSSLNMEELTDKHLADFEEHLQANKLDDLDRPSLTGMIVNPDDHEPPNIQKGESIKTAGTSSGLPKASKDTLKSKKIDKPKILPPRFKIYALNIGPLKIQANNLISMSGSIQFGWQNLLWEITKVGEPTLRIKFKWSNICAMRVFKHGHQHSGLAIKLNASPEFYLEGGITDVKTRRTKWNTMMDFTNGEARRHWHIIKCCPRQAKKIVRVLKADPRFPRLITMENLEPINLGPNNELGNGEAQQQQQVMKNHHLILEASNSLSQLQVRTNYNQHYRLSNPDNMMLSSQSCGENDQRQPHEEHNIPYHIEDLNLGPVSDFDPNNEHELGNGAAQQQEVMKNHHLILEASNSLSQLQVQTNYNQHYPIPNPDNMMLPSQSSGENDQRQPHEEHNIPYHIEDLALGPVTDFDPTGWMCLF